MNKTNLEREIEVSEKNIKDFNKVLKCKDKELHDLQKVNEKVTEDLGKVRDELKHLTMQVNREKRCEAKKLKKAEKKDFLNSISEKVPEIQCEKCDLRTESQAKLRIHERSMHQLTKSIQTNVTEYDEKAIQTQHHEFCEDKSTETHEKIEIMQCFYCGITIVSEIHLKDHSNKCHGMTGIFSVL